MPRAVLGTVLFAAAAVLLGVATCATATDFSDVPTSFWAWKYIQGVSDAGVAKGYTDGTYQPGVTVTRDQMAVYVSRALAKGDANVPSGPPTATFTDVATTNWAYRYVEYAVVNGVVTGYSDQTYRPTQEVNRGQMAVYISRAIATPTGEAGLASYTPPTTPSFADVATDHWAYKYIEYAKSRDVVQGYPDGYRPEEAVNRAQMAVYVVRAFDLPTPAQRYDIGDYFPLAEGNSWVNATPGGGITATVSGTKDIGGKAYSRLVESGGDELDWLLDAEGLHLGGGVHTSGTTATTVTYSPAFSFPRTMAVDDTATMTAQVSYNGVPAGSGSFTYKLVGVESVTVQAGTFQNCLKLEVQLTQPGLDAQRFYLWLAPGVGEVKEDERPFGGGNGSELAGATIGGVQIPTPSSLMADYWPLAQGNTWVEQWGSPPNVYIETVTVEGTIVVGGKTFVRLEYADEEQDFLLSDAEGIHMGGSYKHGETITANPPLLIPNDLQVNQPVSQTSTMYRGTTAVGTLSATITWLGTETVIVPAGVFPYCRKIEKRLREPQATADKIITTWYAQGVGPVKEHEVGTDGGTDDAVLQSATVGGVHYPK